VAKFKRRAHRFIIFGLIPAGMEQIPTRYCSIGQPVITPGSIGTASWLLLGSQKSAVLHGSFRI
jgi:RNA-splicing ligase RtcB